MVIGCTPVYELSTEPKPYVADTVNVSSAPAVTADVLTSEIVKLPGAVVAVMVSGVALTQ